MRITTQLFGSFSAVLPGGGQFCRRKIAGRYVFVMREDENFIHGLNGNKGRKLYNLAKSNPFPRVILSYGGVQSNSMLALAKLAHSRGCEFVYFSRKIPKTVKAMNAGNFGLSLDLNMKVRTVNDMGLVSLINCIAL
jgi:1-aminocyclopropane-1-carboxylate deaminase/D-cysteine desulfhydrase-like pyridoxal-dependent ACC family enzyme